MLVNYKKLQNGSDTKGGAQTIINKLIHFFEKYTKLYLSGIRWYKIP